MGKDNAEHDAEMRRLVLALAMMFALFVGFCIGLCCSSAILATLRTESSAE